MLDDHPPLPWKRTCHTDINALVEKQLKEAAYYIAEKDGFKKSQEEYWQEALKARKGV